MANHSLPQTTSTYANFVSEVNARITDVALGLDDSVVTASNVPTNAIRWKSSLGRWEKYNGTTWAILSNSYNININGTVGATTASSGAFTTLSSSGTTALHSSTTIGGIAAVTTTGVQTIENKTLLTPVLSATASGTTSGRLGYLSGTFSYGDGSIQRVVVNTDQAQSLTNKTISTGSVWNGSAIAVLYGGTGATTATDARTNLSVPSTTGGGASGTWSIAITGNAGTVTNGVYTTSAVNIARGALPSTDFNTLITAGTYTYGTASWTGYTNHPADSYTYGSLVNFTDSLRISQLVIPHQGGMAVRAKYNASDWQAWRYVLDSVNFNSYAPTLTGAGASGSWSISITGSAGSVTNGVYSTGDQSIGGHKTFTGQLSITSTTNLINKNNPAIANGSYASGQNHLELRTTDNSNPAIGFHRSGATAVTLYHTDNSTLRLRDANTGTDSILIHTNNYNSYAPTLTGTGASGSWGISITGNAGTATTLATARNINGVSFNGSANISINTNNSVTFNNGGTGAASGTTFNGSSAVTVSYNTVGAPSTTGTNASGTWGISITGNAGTATSATSAGSATTATTASNLTNFTSSISTNPVAADTNLSNTIGYVNSNISLFGQVDGAIHTQAHSTSWVHQIYGDYRTGQIAIRGRNSGAWQAWRTVLDSSNYNSYAPTLTGTGASGNWGISITGNAATAGGLAVHTGTNNAANQIVRTDGSGYIQAGYIHSASGNEGNNSSPARVWGTNGSDSYFRTYLTSALSVNYANSAGAVPWSGVSSKPASIMFYEGFTLNADTMSTNATGFTYASNAPFTGPIIRVSAGGGYDMWLNAPYSGGDGLAVRTRNGDTNTMNSWRRVVLDTNNSSLNGDSRNTRGVTRLYRRDDNSDYSVQNHWTGSRWLLRGYNGDTFHAECEVGSVTNQANSATITASTAVTANNIVLRDGNGYINANHINFNTSETENPTISSFLTSNGDGWSRKSSIAHVRTQLNCLLLGGGGMTGLLSTVGNSAAFTAANDTTISVRSSGTTTPAVMSFHRPGAYAVNFGLDTDNVFKLGGWSATIVRHSWDMSGNYTATGNVTAFSDIRLKTNIEKIPDALAKVNKLSGYTYKRIDTGEQQTGLIAQEVEKVLPEAVMQGETLSLAYGNMVGLLVEAIKELYQELQEVKAQLK
jgi:hypothetical protein